MKTELIFIPPQPEILHTTSFVFVAKVGTPSNLAFVATPDALYCKRSMPRKELYRSPHSDHVDTFSLLTVQARNSCTYFLEVATCTQPYVVGHKRC